MKKLALVLVLAGAAAACSSTQPIAQPGTVPPARDVTPPPPAAVDPVGMFDFTTSVEGMAVAGTVTIARATTGTGYTGSIATNVTETIPIRSVAVDGQKLTVVADTPDGAITFTMEFKGDNFSGTWAMPGMSGTHAGMRRKS